VAVRLYRSGIGLPLPSRRLVGKSSGISKVSELLRAEIPLTVQLEWTVLVAFSVKMADSTVSSSPTHRMKGPYS